MFCRELADKATHGGTFDWQIVHISRGGYSGGGHCVWKPTNEDDLFMIAETESKLELQKQCDFSFHYKKLKPTNLFYGTESFGLWQGHFKHKSFYDKASLDLPGDKSEIGFQKIQSPGAE